MSLWNFTPGRWLQRPTERYGRGVVEVLGRSYGIQEVELIDSEAAGCWDVWALGGESKDEVRRVVAEPTGLLRCDCQDAIFRDRECKHSRAVKVLRGG